MKNLLLASTALLTVASGSVMAADMRPAPAAPAPIYTKAPMMPVWNWSGCYIGVEGGGASLGISTKDFGELNIVGAPP